MEGTCKSPKDEESTEIPVAPPRTKKKRKVATPVPASKDNTSPSYSPSAPERPPATWILARHRKSTDSSKDLELLQPQHNRLQKTSSVPLRPVVEQKRAPERPVTPNLKPTSPVMSLPPRSKSSLSNHPEQHVYTTRSDNHSRSSSDTHNIYSTGPRRKNRPQRSKSEDESFVTILDSRAGDKSTYLNVAPRAPTNARRTNKMADQVNRAALVKAYSQDSKSSSPNRALSSSQSTPPPKRPPNPPSRERNKQKVKPRRPTPPSRTPHIYTEIGPTAAEDLDSDAYSYVVTKPRFLASLSRQVQGLDLDGRQEHYVNDDYHGPVRKRAGSMDEGIYMSLTATTLTQSDIYMTPEVNRTWPHSYDSEEDSGYLVPTDARLLESGQLLRHEPDEEHYMPLVGNTVEQPSIYHSLTVSSQT